MTDKLDETRPIIGIENRTAQEVFDIMVDRIRASAGPVVWVYEHETEGVHIWMDRSSNPEYLISRGWTEKAMQLRPVATREA